MQKFRIPAKALRRQYLANLVLPPLFVAAIMWFKNVSFPAIWNAFMLLVYAGATVVVFLLARTRVWNIVSESGLQGRGTFGRTVSAPWTASVILSSIASLAHSRIPGVTMIKVDKDGIPESTGGIFIPKAILESSDFQSAIARFAPAEHPLARALRSAA